MKFSNCYRKKENANNCIETLIKKSNIIVFVFKIVQSMHQKVLNLSFSS